MVIITNTTKLLDSFWWEGPNCLKEERQFWPQQNYKTNQDKIMEERKKSVTTMLSPNKIDVSWAYRKFSNFEQIVKLFGENRRFCHYTKNPSSKIKDSTLEFGELQEAQLNFL